MDNRIKLILRQAYLWTNLCILQNGLETMQLFQIMQKFMLREYPACVLQVTEELMIFSKVNHCIEHYSLPANLQLLTKTTFCAYNFMLFLVSSSVRDKSKFFFVLFCFFFFFLFLCFYVTSLLTFGIVRVQRVINEISP